MRAVTPVVAVVLLAAIATLGAVAVASAVAVDPGEPSPTARLTLRVDAATDRIAVTHVGGDALSVADLSVTVRVNGRPLDHQPPVPFFAARGFRAGPEGPFNAASDGPWTAGRTAAVELASTNAPAIDPGDRVAVTVATERAVVADLERTAS